MAGMYLKVIKSQLYRFAGNINMRISATVHPGLFCCEIRKYYWKLKSQKKKNPKVCRYFQSLWRTNN
jgi:hypothetical protein